MKPVRTVVVHAGGIGDFLLACPALARLAEKGPIELLGRRQRLELAVVAGIAEKAYDLEDVDFDSVFHEPGARLRAFLAPFEQAIVWMRDTGGIADALRACGVRRVQVFPGLPPPGWRRHASEYYLELLGFEKAEPFCLGLRPPQHKHDVIIHPGSGSRSKDWPLERFLDVAGTLEERGLSVEWCLGPAEVEKRMDQMLGDGRRVLPSMSLVGLARELAGAGVYIGNDTGVTHLAAASGCLTVAVFGPTDPGIWAPLGENVTVVRGAPWPCVAEVLGAARLPARAPGKRD